MDCNFSENGNEETMSPIDGQNISQSNHFHYLGSIIQNNGDIGENIRYRIRVSWMQHKGASRKCV